MVERVAKAANLLAVHRVVLLAPGTALVLYELTLDLRDGGIFGIRLAEDRPEVADAIGVERRKGGGRFVGILSGLDRNTRRNPRGAIQDVCLGISDTETHPRTAARAGEDLADLLHSEPFRLR